MSGSRSHLAARALAAATLLAFALASSDCSRSVLSRKYEYDEDVYLRLDGSATVYLSASVPALVALRGVKLNPDPTARFDRAAIRALYTSPVTQVESISGSRRDNRRYAHLRIEVSDITRLGEVAPFAWSRYSLARQDDVLLYKQELGASAAQQVPQAGWTGQELIAVRLHLPSRVRFHNSPSGEIQRGNIIAWEQPLSERLAGRQLPIEVHIETQSILLSTLILFGITVVLAAGTFAVAIWYVMRRGRRSPVEGREGLP